MHMELDVGSPELLVAAVDDGELRAVDAELVWLTRGLGYEPADLVDRFGASRDTLLRRRHRAERRLADRRGTVADRGGVAA